MNDPLTKFQKAAAKEVLRFMPLGNAKADVDMLDALTAAALELVEAEIDFIKEHHLIPGGMHFGCELCPWLDQRKAQLKKGEKS